MTATALSPPRRLPHLPELDGLRAPLAWWVVVSHCLLFAGYTLADFPGAGLLLLKAWYGVDVFVLLSGLVITRLIVQGRESYPVYLWRRWLRLFPAYAACLMITLLLALAGVTETQVRNTHPNLPHSTWRDGFVAREGMVASRPVAHSLAHLSMLHGVIPESVLPQASLTLVAPSWSISLEWQFYILAPLLVWLARRSPTIVVLILAVCVVGPSILARKGVEFNEIGAFLPLHARYFWLGGLSYFALVEMASASWTRNAVMIAVGCILTFTPAMHAVLERYLFQDGEWIPLSIWAVVMAALAAPRPNLVSRALSCRPFQLLGRISYSTYLSHMFAIDVCAYFAPASITSRAALFGYLMLTVVPLVFVISLLMHRWVEVPGIEFGKRRSAPKPGSASGETASPVTALAEKSAGD